MGGSINIRYVMLLAKADVELFRRFTESKECKSVSLMLNDLLSTWPNLLLLTSWVDYSCYMPTQ